jgi:hypothetical protein
VGWGRGAEKPREHRDIVMLPCAFPHDERLVFAARFPLNSDAALQDKEKIHAVACLSSFVEESAAG